MARKKVLTRKKLGSSAEASCGREESEGARGSKPADMAVEKDSTSSKKSKTMKAMKIKLASESVFKAAKPFLVDMGFSVLTTHNWTVRAPHLLQEYFRHKTGEQFSERMAAVVIDRELIEDLYGIPGGNQKVTRFLGKECESLFEPKKGIFYSYDHVKDPDFRNVVEVLNPIMNPDKQSVVRKTSANCFTISWRMRLGEVFLFVPDWVGHLEEHVRAAAEHTTAEKSFFEPYLFHILLHLRKLSPEEVDLGVQILVIRAIEPSVAAIDGGAESTVGAAGEGDEEATAEGGVEEQVPEDEQVKGYSRKRRLIRGDGSLAGETVPQQSIQDDNRITEDFLQNALVTVVQTLPENQEQTLPLGETNIEADIPSKEKGKDHNVEDAPSDAGEGVNAGLVNLKEVQMAGSGETAKLHPSVAIEASIEEVVLVERTSPEEEVLVEHTGLEEVVLVERSSPAEEVLVEHTGPEDRRTHPGPQSQTRIADPSSVAQAAMMSQQRTPPRTPPSSVTPDIFGNDPGIEVQWFDVQKTLPSKNVKAKDQPKEKFYSRRHPEGEPLRDFPTLPQEEGMSEGTRQYRETLNSAPLEDLCLAFSSRAYISEIANALQVLGSTLHYKYDLIIAHWYKLLDLLDLPSNSTPAAFESAAAMKEEFQRLKKAEKDLKGKLSSQGDLYESVGRLGSQVIALQQQLQEEKDRFTGLELDRDKFRRDATMFETMLRSAQHNQRVVQKQSADLRAVLSSATDLADSTEKRWDELRNIVQEEDKTYVVEAVREMSGEMVRAREAETYLHCRLQEAQVEMARREFDLQDSKREVRQMQEEIARLHGLNSELNQRNLALCRVNVDLQAQSQAYKETTHLAARELKQRQTEFAEQIEKLTKQNQDLCQSAQRNQDEWQKKEKVLEDRLRADQEFYQGQVTELTDQLFTVGKPRAYVLNEACLKLEMISADFHSRVADVLTLHGASEEEKKVARKVYTCFRNSEVDFTDAALGSIKAMDKFFGKSPSTPAMRATLARMSKDYQEVQSGTVEAGSSGGSMLNQKRSRSPSPEGEVGEPEDKRSRQD